MPWVIAGCIHRYTGKVAAESISNIVRTAELTDLASVAIVIC